MCEVKKITVFKSFAESSLKMKDNDDFASFWRALLEYAFYGKEPELDGVPDMLFTALRDFIDTNIKNAENGEKGKEYGKLGGRPKKTPGGFEEETQGGFENKTLNKNKNIEEEIEKEKEIEESICESDDSTPSLSEESLVKSSRKSKVVEKQKYGDYRHVELSTEEYERLQQDFPTEYSSMIQKLDEYIETHRGTERKYKNHNLVMRNWYRRDGSNNFSNKTSTNFTEDKPKPDHYVAWQLKHQTEESKPILI